VAAWLLPAIVALLAAVLALVALLHLRRCTVPSGCGCMFHERMRRASMREKSPADPGAFFPDRGVRHPAPQTSNAPHTTRGVSQALRSHASHTGQKCIARKPGPEIFYARNFQLMRFDT
jgi:hypothetical protein